MRYRVSFSASGVVAGALLAELNAMACEVKERRDLDVAVGSVALSAGAAFAVDVDGPGALPDVYAVYAASGAEPRVDDFCEFVAMFVKADRR